MNDQASVDKNFRRFLVYAPRFPGSAIGGVILAEGVQYQDEQASTRETTRKPVRATTHWDCVADLLAHPTMWGEQPRIVWLDEEFAHMVSSTNRRFVLQRDIDETGVSGTGRVAEGLQFEDGRATMRWCVNPARSTTTYDNTTELITIHGHDGKTKIIWID